MTSTDDEKMFKALTDEAIAAEALNLLDLQMTRCKAWLMEQRESGNAASLADLIRQTISEPNQRRHVLIAYTAALWKLMGETNG